MANVKRKKNECLELKTVVQNIIQLNSLNNPRYQFLLKIIKM